MMRERDDLAQCRAMIKVGSRSFFAASLLLTQNVREPAYALYAFCRLADDAVDLGRDRLGALARLEIRLHAVYAGKPLDNPCDRAFTRVVEQFAIPRRLPEALLEGLRWDAEGRLYHELADLEAYATRVAGTVGAMMTLIMGVREPATLARATDLGIAMQLTNIARDVGEDALNGRLYLPRKWLVAAHIDPDAFIQAPRFDDRLAGVVERLLEAADQLYARATPGIAELPLACRPAMRAASMLYAEIGREVRRSGHDSVTRRAVVSGRRKLELVGQAFVEAPLLAKGETAPALPAAQFLVDAVEAHPLNRRQEIPWWEFGRRFGRMIELMFVAEARRQGRRPYREAQA
jgi:phytoene synthase